MNLKKEIPIITNLATTNSLNTKISEVKKNPKISNLATTTPTTSVENKVPNVSNLVEKTDYKSKICQIENKKLLLIMIMINILLIKNLIFQQHKILLQD